MKEVIAVANEERVYLSEQDINEQIDIIKGLSSEGKTSMCQDVLAGRKTEVECFAGVVCELGKQHGNYR